MKFDSFEDCLDDLAVRFLIYLPPDERSTADRLGFHLEQAFWFYTDMYAPENPDFPQSLTLRTFTPLLLSRLPSTLIPPTVHTPTLVNDFMAYKAAVPVCGCILLNPARNKVLMVRGWAPRSRWGFPKGKIARGEASWECAARECFEECGYRPAIAPHRTPYIEYHTKQHAVRLYVVEGVGEEAGFAPRTRNEIGAIAWHLVQDLPDREGHCNAKYYFDVRPVVGQLRKAIGRMKKAARPHKKQADEDAMEAADDVAECSLEHDPGEPDLGHDSELEEAAIDAEAEAEAEVEVETEGDGELATDDLLIDLKPVWIGRPSAQTVPQSSDLLSLFKRPDSRPARSSGPSTPGAMQLLQRLRGEGVPKLYARDECLEKIASVIPKSGLTAAKLDAVLRALK